MAEPLKIKKSGATFQGLQTMTTAEQDYAAHIILKNFASSATGLGTVNIDGVSGTSIGTFSDTTRPYTVGQHPVGTDFTTVTYTFKQVVSPAESESSLARPVEYSTSGVRQQNDTQLNAAVISRALSNMVAGGVGVYKLQPSAPVGTWVSRGTITNTTSAGTNTSTLWQRTDNTAPTTVRPIKYSSSALREMTDADIQTLTARFRNRIVDTGIGTYKVQTSAPTPGTWVTSGSAFDDTRNQLANQTYTGSYSGSYSGNYTGTYTTAFSGTYTTAFSGTYSRAFSGTYILYYAGRNAGSFTGSYTGFFTGSYTGSFSGSYTGSFSGSYTGNYTGNYSGNYTGATIQATLETVSTVSLWLKTA
jgi:hypothetical protein